MKIPPLSTTAAAQAVSPDVPRSGQTVPWPKPPLPVRHPAVVQVGFMPLEISEASGLLRSRRHPDRLWVHNDSDRGPLLYAVRPDGRMTARVQLENAEHYDWEDLAWIDIDGRQFLAVCDLGDNLKERETCVIHLLPEPDPNGGDQTATPAHSIRFRYEDGPRDVEAVAADGDRLLLLTKRDHPPVLYELPLRGVGVRVARRLGNVTSIPPAPLSLPSWTSQPTGMDIDPAGRRLVVLTYSQLCLYERRAGESWAAALGRRPVMLPAPEQPQAEGVGFSNDGRFVYVTSEGRWAPIHRVELNRC